MREKSVSHPIQNTIIIENLHCEWTPKHQYLDHRECSGLRDRAAIRPPPRKTENAPPAHDTRRA